MDILCGCCCGYFKLYVVVVVTKGSGQKDRYGWKGAVDENSVKKGNCKVGIGRNVIRLGSGRHGEKR